MRRNPRVAPVIAKVPSLVSSLAIEVHGAETHNLKQVDCRVPHGQLTVLTGVSGAGKSSLAFDTIYAEAQRRFVESMSTYVRQFLGPMERPPMVGMSNVLPAVALAARNSVKNARSTVGTLTEIYDLLRLLYTHLGEVSCPEGHGQVFALTPQEAADWLLERAPGSQLTVLVSLSRPSRQADAKLHELVRQGYFRRWEDGAMVRMTASERWPKSLATLTLALSRCRADQEGRGRLIAAIEEAYHLAAGRLQVQVEGGPCWHLGRSLTCATCGCRLERPSPALFSFNSPLGACKTCQGFGRMPGIDVGRVIPDPRKCLRDKPIAPWNSPAYDDLYPLLFDACRAEGIRLDVPWQDLEPHERHFVWSGEGRQFESITRFFAYLERKTYKMHVRILIARYRSYESCPDCAGNRLKKEALAVRIGGRSIADLANLSIERLTSWLETEFLPATQAEAAGHFLEQLKSRLEVLERVGLGYLTLSRSARTLSGGESQRIQLSSALSMAMTGMLYVLDEPTIGLHPRDSGKLLGILRELTQRGNTVLVVEHDRTLIEGADHVIDMGPRAGEHGGEVVVEGRLADILACPQSLTATYLRQALHPNDEGPWSHPPSGFIEIRGARAHNLRGFDVALPKNCLIALVGVSGSGKSTLVKNVLFGSYQRQRGVVDTEPGENDGLVGLEGFVDLELVDQKPLSRSSRSNPATYTKAWDEIRKLFAATPEAKSRGIGPGHFSFNTDLGRCPRCEGLGTVEVEMYFMAALSVTCDDCQGRRFRPEILALRWQGYSVHQILELTVEEALGLFAGHRSLCRRLEPLAAVGLGYLRLGQSTATLSGGEAQRLKLASFLDSKNTPGPHLFLFDEPTTGLHLADIALLHQTFRRLIQAGHSVVVVEHSLDLIARADWIVELGPGGGQQGGALLYSGRLAAFLQNAQTPTADELRKIPLAQTAINLPVSEAP